MRFPDSCRAVREVQRGDGMISRYEKNSEIVESSGSDRVPRAESAFQDLQRASGELLSLLVLTLSFVERRQVQQGDRGLGMFGAKRFLGEAEPLLVKRLSRVQP